MRTRNGLFLVLSLLTSTALFIAGCSDSGGTLGNGGTLQVGPAGVADYNSVQAAVDDAPAGAVIEILPGTYQEQVIVSRQVTLRGNGGAVMIRMPGARGSSSGTDDSADDSTAALVIRDTADVAVENLAVSGPEDGILVRNSTRILLDGVDCSGNGDDGLDVRSSSMVTARGTFSNNMDKGILVRDGSSAVTIEGSAVQGNQGNGVRLRDSQTVVMDGSTVESNTEDGIEIRDASAVQILGNTVRSNGEYGVRIENAPDTLLEGNTIEGNVDGDVRQE